MLSLAWLTIFKNALDALDGLPKPFENVNHLARWIISTPAFSYRPPLDFPNTLRDDLENAPPLEDLGNPNHEIAMWRGLLKTTSPPTELAIRLLVRLASRGHRDDGDPYRDTSLPLEALSGYPLYLRTLRNAAATRWIGLSGESWLQALVSEVLLTHQRIAIRKMGQSGEDTLMFRSGDLGFFVHRELEEIVETQPRPRQALQILRDLGFASWDVGRFPRLTPLGESQLLEIGS